MSRKTTIEWTCDGCGKTVDSVRELQGFALVKRGRGRARDEYENADLCELCEVRLIEATEPILGSEVAVFLR